MPHASYLTSIVYPEKLSYCAVKLANQINDDKKILGINSVAVIGLSGYVIGGVISSITRLPLILIRKESSHSNYKVEYNYDLNQLNYCIVDDLIASGNTLTNIVIKIHNEKIVSSLKKIYLYADTEREEYDVLGKSYPVYSFSND